MKSLAPVVMSLALVALSLFAVALDIRTRRLPNWLTIGGAGIGFLCSALVGVPGLAGSAMGGGLGLLVGLVAFATGILGAGDGKLLMACGTFLGPHGLLTALLAIAVAGGVLGLIDALQQGRLGVALRRVGLGLANVVTLGRFGAMPPRDEAAVGRVPYGVAIAAGTLFTWFWEGRLT